MLYPDTSHRPAVCHQRDLLCAAAEARLAASVLVRPVPAWSRWLLLRTGILLVSLGTRLEVRALRPRSRSSPMPAAVRDWHALVS